MIYLTIKNAFLVFRRQCSSIGSWLSEGLLCGVRGREEGEKERGRPPAHLHRSMKTRPRSQKQKTRENHQSHEARLHCTSFAYIHRLYLTLCVYT